VTGLRQGELIALRWRDVDWLAGPVRVADSYTRGRLGSPKSGEGRSVPMADRVAGELERLYRQSSFQGEDDLVFCLHRPAMCSTLKGFADASARRCRTRT
jgi:integrase